LIVSYEQDSVGFYQSYNCKTYVCGAIVGTCPPCQDVKMVADAQQGYTGGDAYTIEGAKYKENYLVYVDTFKTQSMEAIKQSGARVTYFIQQDQNEMEIKLDTNLYNGQRYWVVGCIRVGTNNNNGVDKPYSYIAPVTSIFFDKDPVTELKNGYCSGLKQ
jgi:hypothetical protein